MNIIEGYDNESTEAEADGHAKHFFLGQTYPYHKNVMGPDYLGMSSEGSMEQMGKNVAGLINYAQILITGDGHANAKVNREGRDEALGDKFFMKTMGKCYPIKVGEDGKPLTQLYNKNDGTAVDATSSSVACNKREVSGSEECDFIYYKNPNETEDKTDEQNDADAAESNTMTEYKKDHEIKNLNDEKKDKQRRYVYIDNLPTGRIPGLGALHGMRGFIPAMIENLGHFNPMKLVDSMSAPAIPPCVKLNMETIKFKGDSPNSETWRHEYNRDTHFVALSDVSDIYPCSFSDSKNPISGASESKCPKHVSEMFGNIFEANNEKGKKMLNLKNKPIAKLFNVSFGLLLAYLLWNVLKKEMKK